MSFFKDKLFAILFLIACLLSTAPVILNLFVLSLDGPSHLYNANLIFELLKGNTVVSHYFSFNNLHFTNWTGHLILALFKLALPGWISQKILITCLVILLPLSFAFLVNKLNYKSRYLSFIIFPFTYSGFFFLGFYNYLLAIIFFFLWLAFVFNEGRIYSSKEKVLIFILFLLMECSHVFIFIIALAIFFAHLIFPVFVKNKFQLFFSFKEIFKPLLNIFILSSGGLLLFLFYLINKSGPVIEKTSAAVPWTKILSGIVTISPVLGLGNYNIIFTSILFILLTTTAIYFIDRKKPLNNNLMLFAALTALFFYIITMIFLEQGLYIQDRFLLLFFLFLLIWISLQKAPRLMQTVLILFSIYVSTTFIVYYQKTLPLLSKRCYNIYNLGHKIDKNARIYCMNFSNHWLEGHQLNYLGADNPVILYENYECFQKYFPLKWKDPDIIRKIINDFDSGIYSKTFSENVDYVAIIEEPKEKAICEKNKSLILTKNFFIKVLESEDQRLMIYKKIKKE